MSLQSRLRMMVVGLSLILSSGSLAAESGANRDATLGFAPPATSDSFSEAAVSRSEQAGYTLLRVEGIITPGTERHFGETLRTLPAGQPLLVELSSPGGFTTAGYRMIDGILAERNNGRPVATRVRAGDSCESMCVGLYLAGFPRYAAPTAEFMVHAPRLAENGGMTVRATEAMVQRLVSLGASPVWIGRVKAAGGFSGNMDYRESADRLIAEGANVVTELVR